MDAMTRRKPKASLGAARQKAYRARQKSGTLVARINIHHDVILALMVSGRLAEMDADNPRKVIEAAESALDAWCAPWIELHRRGVTT
jgi:hypothetical protein